MNELANKECKPCKGDTPPLKPEEIQSYQKKLQGDWSVVDNHHLEKNFKFSNFREALDFTKDVGELAEQQGHHPDILLSWGKATITLCTHSINGLSESDFVLAAKIDQLG